MTDWPVLAIVPAAGSGSRLGNPVPKQFLELDGVPVLIRTLRALGTHPDVAEIVVAVPPDYRERARALIDAAGPPAPTTVVAGGASRQESVRLALQAREPGLHRFARVLVHDAARPFLSAPLLDRALRASRDHEAVICAVPLRDTIKRAGPDLRVLETPPRDSLWAAQTPQVFAPDLLRAAHAAAMRAGEGGDAPFATDDASLVERLGRPVQIVNGEDENLKLTTPADFRAAEARAGRRAGPRASGVRTGFGYDVHRLEPGRRLVLGGVEFDHALGLAGHSDADVLLHAIMDALLGAAGLGDIGQIFPSDDPAYRGASSVTLLAEVHRRVAAAGYAPAHVDATVVAEAPRLAGRVAEMRRVIGRLLGLSPERVSVKATTNEGLGAIGEGRGISAYAVATLVDKSG